MSVYQIEEYYISINNVIITEKQKQELINMFYDNNVSDYEIEADLTGLVANCFESEQDAENIEEIIKGVLDL